VVSLPFVARLAFIAVALLTVAPLEAQAQSRPSSNPYGTAIWSTAREYCALLESGMSSEQAFNSAMRGSADLWRQYTRNDPARFRAAVSAEAARQCVPTAVPTAAQQAAQFCPGLTTAQMAAIASGRRLAVIWPGCHMEFN
jgi:hypothetical protein